MVDVLAEVQRPTQAPDSSLNNVVVWSVREERVKNKTKNSRVRSLREERVTNRTRTGRVQSVREARVRNRANNNKC